MQGNSEFVDGSSDTIVGATTSWQYKLNQTNDNKSIKLEIIDYSNSSTLNDMNITNGKRFFQFSNGDTREYHIKESLDATNAGEFNIIGNNKNIISGILDGTTNQKGSFFNIADGTDVAYHRSIRSLYERSGNALLLRCQPYAFYIPKAQQNDEAAVLCHVLHRFQPPERCCLPV